MKNLIIACSFVGIFFVAPIWYYLLYKILLAVGASELMWFLFWIYVPLTLIINALIKFAVSELDK